MQQTLSNPTIMAPPITDLNGLSHHEAETRRQRGLGNNVRIQTSRTYLEIIRANVFTFINMVLFSIGLALVLLGLYTDASLSVGIASLNIVIGLAQEIRAKQALDKIALLTRPKATVIRQSQEQVVDPTEIVVGDVLVARAGDQIIVDGQVVGDGRMDADESLLTGESDLITKRAGDPVYSGSFCVNGSTFYVAEKVGAQSLANQLTTGARAFKLVKTPLQLDIDLLVRLLIVLTVHMAILFGLSAIVSSLPLTETARVAAVIAGLIPNGLFFMTSIAYAMGAVRMAGQGALIQQSNAVESMSNVNVLCLDKTGTLTANRIHLHQTAPYQMDDAEFRRLLGLYAASAGTSNKTSEALALALPQKPLPFLQEIPFSSARKWSALSFDQPDLRGVYVLGAPEMLRPYLDESSDLGTIANQWTDKGLRVLLFAYHPEVTPLLNSLDQPQLPPDLTPLGLISFSDELRPQADQTIRGFIEAGIRLKIISGDHPHTVAALAKQAGLDGEVQVIAGPDLDEMTEAQFAEAAENATVFGRITPQQKERLVDKLRGRGHYVAMIGDGVNDVLSLKKAHIGIAMQSGSQATRGVADIILLNDSFAALPSAFREGQRIVNGMMDIMRLFLTRILFQTLIIAGAAIIGLGFPVTPIHQSLLSLFTVGIPVLFLAAWSRPGVNQGRLVNTALRFVLPAGISIAFFGLGLYSLTYINTFYASSGATTLNFAMLTDDQIQALEAARQLPIDQIFAQAEAAALASARTLLTVFTTLAGLVIVVFVEPPTRFWVGGDEFSGDWRPTLLAGLLALAFIAILLVPDWRDFFTFTALGPSDWLVVVGLLVVWLLLLRFIWRQRLLVRFLRLG